MGYSPRGRERVGHDLATKQQERHLAEAFPTHIFPQVTLFCPFLACITV